MENNNEYAMSNIETMAHNVMIYRSYYTSKEDACGEVDDAAQAAENALLHLVNVMNKYK